MNIKSKCICGKNADKYCGKCKVQRYCDKECQIKRLGKS